MIKLALSIFIMIPASAFAGYIINKSKWDEMKDITQYGYVMGSFDENSVLNFPDDEYNSYKKDINNCVISLDLRSLDLVNIIDTEYQDLSNWDKPANVVLHSGLRKVCLSYMNRARTQRGDTPLE